MSAEGTGGDVVFSRRGWVDYQYWVQTDRKVAIRVARLITECQRDPFSGMGNPEPLRHGLAGYWSRRISREHRLIYKVEDGRCVIVQCRYHY